MFVAQINPAQYCGSGRPDQPEKHLYVSGASVAMIIGDGTARWALESAAQHC